MNVSKVTWILVCMSSLLPIFQLAAADAKSLIAQAYERTKGAATRADYDAIIGLCDQARKSTLDAAQEKYVVSLLAWAHNRRGESLNEEAAGALERGEADKAAELDGQALTDFETAIQFDASRWKPWHNRGVSYAIAGKYSEAISDFSKVIELNPSYANAHFNRAEIRFDIGQIEESLQDYTEAIRLDPKDNAAYTGRAQCYLRLGDYPSAVAEFDNVLKQSPADAVVLAYRGEAYQKLGRWQQAAEDLRRAIQLDPSSARVLQIAAWLMATCPDDAIRSQKLAVEAAEKAVQLSREPDSRFLDTLAAAYANANQFPLAVAKMNEALQRAPASEIAGLQQRLALYQQQRPYRQDDPALKSAAISKVGAK